MGHSPLIEQPSQLLSRQEIGLSPGCFMLPNFRQRWRGNAVVESCRILSLTIHHMCCCSETMKVDQVR